MKSKINVQSENIFPIIKKWLYSDHDIFVREMVSNACDAITKHKKIVSGGEAADDGAAYRVRVTVSKKSKYIAFDDNGVGMTDEEVQRYLNEVAFSGAEEFLAKYKGDGAGIIGHFGLGFYSAFMVADKVTVDTLSYREGAEAVRWSCDGSTDVEIEKGQRTERGTAVTLFVGDGGKEFTDIAKLLGVLQKYCAYLPVEITLINADKPKEEPKVINKKPLWTIAPRECSDEDYKNFYHEMFHDFADPLFWIHLNVDYPFNLQGILFFPAADLRNFKNEGAIKLFNNRVYVADNIKDVIPEYLMLLRGVLDCPDMPLNVSRSFLQNDGYLNKIKTHITKKVCEKLKTLYKTDAESYQGYWKNINPFVKYGCMTDKGFFGKVKDAVLLKTVDGKFMPLEAALRQEGAKEDEAPKGTVYYVNDAADMALYEESFSGMRVLLMDDMIDTHFLQFLEGEYSGLKFMRVDGDAAALKRGDSDDSGAADGSALVQRFKTVLTLEKVEAAAIKPNVPLLIVSGENARRMEAMGRAYGMDTQMFKDEKLIINTAHPLIKQLAASDEGAEERIKLLYGLARLSNNTLPNEETATLIRAILDNLK